MLSFYQEPSHVDRGALPKLVAEDMMLMSDYELHKCCKYYGVRNELTIILWGKNLVNYYLMG